MVYAMHKVVEVFCVLYGDRSSVNRFNSKVLVFTNIKLEHVELMVRCHIHYGIGWSYDSSNHYLALDEKQNKTKRKTKQKQNKKATTTTTTKQTKNKNKKKKNQTKNQ